MKSCIITGAGSGIGREVAIKLSGYNNFDYYALLGRNQEELLRTKLLMKNGEVEIYNIDLIDTSKIADVVSQIISKTNSIDCLLNIAGFTDPQSLLTTTYDSFETTYKVNVFSPFLLIRECVRYMKENGGKILNIASTAGSSPRPGWLSYSSSKAALISMSLTLAEELAEYGIKVYCVSPGRCATKLRVKLAPQEDPRMIMQPEEVAQVIYNLLITDDGCLDGQNIIVRKQVKKQIL